MVHVDEGGTANIECKTCRAIGTEAHDLVVELLPLGAVHTSGTIAEEQTKRAAVEVDLGVAAIKTTETKGGVVQVNTACGAYAIDFGATGEGVVATIGSSGGEAIDCEHPSTCFDQFRIEVECAVKGGSKRSRHHEGGCGSRGVGDRTADIGSGYLPIVGTDRFESDIESVEVKGSTGVNIEFAVQPCERVHTANFKGAGLNRNIAEHRSVPSQQQLALTKLGERISCDAAGEGGRLASLGEDERFTRCASACRGGSHWAENQIG